MGTLTAADGGRHPLGSRTVIGRSPAAHVLVADPRVSATHAVVGWVSGAWELRDLGSRNGTFLCGERVAPGARVPLRLGDRISVATPDGGFSLTDVGPPRALARSESGDEVGGTESLLALPSAEEPRIVVLLTPHAGWVLERDGTSGPAESTVALDGVRWTLELPPQNDQSPTLGAEQGPTLGFVVSPDEEYVEMELWQGGAMRERWTGKRHLYLLLTLARLRRGSRDDSGWVDLEDLAKMLRMAPKTVDVQVHRARTDLAGHEGVVGRVVERRPGTRMLRLGVAVAWIRVGD